MMTTAPAGTVSATPGHVWAVLNTERQETCASLNSGTGPRPAQQMRLGQIDRALDLLMDGRYGRCVECGGVIEQQRLSADPALTLCYGCQTGIELEHTL